MSQASSKARPAFVEDCDNDSGVVLPDSKREARAQPPPNSQSKHATSTRPDKPRYARTTSAQPPTRSSTPSIPTQSRPKPMIHEPRPKSTVQQTMPPQPPLSRTHSMSSKKPSNSCDDPDCPGGRSRVKQSRAPTPQQHAPLHVQTQNLPSARVARPRSTSMSQGRPLSWAGHQAPYPPEYIPPPMVSPPEYGPPPARSAWYRSQYPYGNQPHSGQGYVVSQPAISPMISSAPPVDLTPLSAQRTNLNYSARMDPSQALPIMSPKSASARIPRARTPSISYSTRPIVIQDPYAVDEPFYESDPEYDREEIYEQHMPPDLRPIMPHSRTTPDISRRSVYKDSGRVTHSDNGVDFLTQDFERHSLRPSLQRKYSSANSSRSRRQSLSTNASSARTKATTVSAGSIIVEGPNGRRRLYPSDREYDSYIRKMASQRKEDDARAYQNDVGGRRDDLTAAHIRDYIGRAPDVTRSRASGHSRQSNSHDGIQIVYAGTRVDVRPANDHIPAQIIIDPISGTETRYAASSHSSSSRIGRSRGSDGGFR